MNQEDISILIGADFGILMCFQIGRVSVAADIEAMFNQVRVSKEDADSLRFLWQDAINSEDPLILIRC